MYKNWRWSEARIILDDFFVCGDEQRAIAVGNSIDVIVANGKKLGAKEFGRMQAAEVLLTIMIDPILAKLRAEREAQKAIEPGLFREWMQDVTGD